MKTKLLAAMIGAAFVAPAFSQQSNITIYGLVDAGIHVSRNGEGTTSKLVSGIAEGSRLGFKGLEDLGGGYKAIFNLEARVEIDTGDNKTGNISSNQGFSLTRGMVFPAPVPQLAPLAAGALATVRSALQPAINVNSSGALFDRTSMVGLITPVGAFMLGRMYTPAYEVFVAADTFDAGTAGTWGGVALGTGGLVNPGAAIRSSNSVQYRIQLPNGILASAMYGFRDSGYAGLDKHFWGAQLRYKANGFDVGVGHNHGTDQNGARGLVSTVLGGSYATGNMKFFAGYQDSENDNSVFIPILNAAWDAQIAPGLIAAGGPASLVNGVYTPIFKNNLINNFKLDASVYQVGMHYNAGAGRIMGSFSFQDDHTVFNNNAAQYAIGYDHFLSKRTDIYTVFSYIDNKNNAQFAPGAASAAGGFTSAPGQNGKALQIGMRHKF